MLSYQILSSPITRHVTVILGSWYIKLFKMHRFMSMIEDDKIYKEDHWYRSKENKMRGRENYVP